MQGWDAVKAALNPFAIGRRRRVPPGAGPGRVLVFAVDGSSESEDAVRFGLDNVARANDTCAFACACASQCKLSVQQQHAEKMLVYIGRMLMGVLAALSGECR